MSIVLHHHPYSRAANVVWMLEEVGVPYTLRFVDIMAGEHKSEAYRALNAMGKLPVIEDGEAVVSESAAIGMYLADRYALGRLAPALDDPARGAYLRWCLYAPSVIEPGCAAHAGGWATKPSAVGWGTYETMLDTLEGGVGQGPWLLGERFTMADVILGGTLRFMMQFKMIEPRPAFAAYVERLSARPAAVAAAAKNMEVMKAHNLGG
ncbi:MAG: glutathione S-transferase family protein [Myxococcota bacterium]